jgi:antitoxin (DNA-binding transcriptional repressor) of toxin-antitoxin stability system
MNKPARTRRGRGPAASGRRVVTASDAAKNFGALVEQVREARETYVVERAGVPVVQITPVAGSHPTVADLVDCLRRSGRLDERYLAEVERGVAFLNEVSIPSSRWAS